MTLKREYENTAWPPDEAESGRVRYCPTCGTALGLEGDDAFQEQAPPQVHVREAPQDRPQVGQEVRQQDPQEEAQEEEQEKTLQAQALRGCPVVFPYGRRF